MFFLPEMILIDEFEDDLFRILIFSYFFFLAFGNLLNVIFWF